MTIVMARCPYRDQPVSTGLEIDAAAFAAMPESLVLARCPLCGLEHVWWKSETWLEPAGHASPVETPSD